MSASSPLLSKKRRYEEDRHSNEEEEDEDDDEEGLRTDYGSAVYHYPPHLQHGHFTSLEKLMFFTSSILLILLFVFVGLYARSSQADDEPSIPLPIPTVPNNKSDQLECHSSNCIITAASILQDVDPELDPCDDFFAYTCNKWQDDHSIPDFKSRIDIQSIAKQSIHRRLDQILTHDYAKFQKLRPDDAWKLPNQDTILDKQLFTKLVDFYASCMNQDAIESIGVEPLFQLFRKIQEFIPLHQPVSQTQLQQAITFLADRHIWTLFELRVIDTPDHRPTLFLSHAPITNTYDPSLYLQTMVATLDKVFSKDTRNEFGFKYWSTTATARRILEFEQTLMDTSSFTTPHDTWTLDKLQEQLPHIDWRAYIQQHIGDLPVPEQVLIPSSEFIENLGRNVLSTTNPRTLQMYFLWRTMWKYVDLLGDEFIVPKRQLEAAMKGMEPRAKPDRRDTCMHVLDQSAMGLLVGRYYVKDREVEIKQSRDKLQAVIADMMNLFKEKTTAKDQMKDKLDKLEFEIGFSKVEPSIESPIALSDYYGDVTIKKDDFFGNVIRNNQHETRQMWKLLGKSTSTTSSVWKMNPQSVHIQYQQELNKVIIPAGLLQLPFYDANGPMYLTIGTLGQMIGREIIHGFDVNGREWTGEKQCLVDQYNDHGIDGERSVDNNYADQLVWIELLGSKENMTTLPGLKQWTKDQLAYIQYSRLFCSKSTKEEQLLKSDIAPDHLRVNMPLVNSIHFAKVFNCKKGTFMNPNHKKCNIW